MKKILKLSCLALGACMAVGITACGKDDGSGGDGGSNGGGSISVHYMAGGFGKEVYEKIAADYKALTGVSVKFNASYSGGEIQNLLLSGQEKNDVVLPLLNMYAAQDANLLEDLTEVYNATYTGESKPIKDKMNKSLYDYIEAKDGKRYQMFGTNSVSAICYNIGTLNEAFGAGQWELPRTTNELVEMSAQLKNKGYYAFTTSTGINYYWDYIGTVWWAQYEGIDSYNNFYYGKYWDSATSEWKLGAQIADARGREVALETLSTVLSSRNGYIHPKSKDMDFTTAQRSFLNNGYLSDKTKVAFMVNGDWLENEMASALLSNPQDIAMMRAPVVSELIEKLSTVNSEATLSAVVKAVDEGKTSYDGVSAEDFARVKEARLMVYTATPNYPVGIPANRPAAKKQLAKDFLVYLHSDRAQKIYATSLQGLTMPVDFNVLDENSGVQVSNFIRSRLSVFGNDMVAIFPRNASPIMYRGGMGDMSVGGGVDGKLFNGTSSSGLLALAKQSIVDHWDEYMKALETSGSGT